LHIESLLYYGQAQTAALDLIDVAGAKEVLE
jgi:hypothetical protein